MGDLISRNAIINILENEINAAKELECQCEEQYKNGFVLKQCNYSFVKECVEALLICPLSSRQVKYLKFSTNDACILI